MGKFQFRNLELLGVWLSPSCARWRRRFAQRKGCPRRVDDCPPCVHLPLFLHSGPHRNSCRLQQSNPRFSLFSLVLLFLSAIFHTGQSVTCRRVISLELVFGQVPRDIPFTHYAGCLTVQLSK